MQDGYAVELGTWNFGPRTEVAPFEELPRQPTLAQIKRLQDVVGVAPQIPLEPEHLFAPGMYTRILAIQADAYVVGKMHRHAHPTMLIKGEATILTNNGMERICAPHVWISQPGAKRPLYTHTDCVFVTVHLNATDTTDLDVLEAEIIIPEALIEYEPKAIPADFTDEIQEIYA